MVRTRILLASAVALLTACQSQTRPAPLLPIPASTIVATHFTGTALTGPRAPTTHATVGNSDLDVEVRWVALAKMPTVSSVALGARAHLIFAGNSRAQLLGSPDLTAEIRIVEGEAAKQLAVEWAVPRSSVIAPIEAASAVLPPGVTAEFSSINTGRTTTLQISRPAAGTRDVPLQIAVTLDASGKKETVLFDRIAVDHADAVALLIPTKFADTDATIFGVAITIGPATGDPDHAEKVARCESDLQLVHRALATRPTISPTEISESAGLEMALSGLANEDQRRPSLVFLADETAARLCQDLSLVADNSVLATLAENIQVQLKADPTAARSAERLAWTLDRSAFEMLSVLADSPEGGKLPPELASVLTHFAGEAARHPSSLDEIAHGVSGESDLHNRIVAQNMIFLTDPSPAARVRAFDWLNSRKLAPAGFDPLGTARERRESISKATSQP